VDGCINTKPADSQMLIGGIDNSIYFHAGDIVPDDAESHVGIPPFSRLTVL
jgi:hypothetical protein